MKIHSLLLLGAALAACDGPSDGKPPAPTRRSDGVVADPAASAEPAKAGPGDRGSVQPATTAVSNPAPKGSSSPRKLCSGQPTREAPPALRVGRSAEGDAPGPLEYGGRWIWLNVWAAWCQPCKEEMPLITGWRDELRKKGISLDLVFVSIDDDEREMTRLIRTQPASGMRASYWLADEESREPFFAALGFDDSPTLPVHAFISPAGKVTCTVQGALEEIDYAEVAAIFTR